MIYKSTFGELLYRKVCVSIHHQNIQKLGMKMFEFQGCQFSGYFRNSGYFFNSIHIPDFVSLLFILIEKFAKTYLDFLINCKQHKTNAYVCC